MGLDGCSASTCRMRALGVVEGHPFADACPSRGPGFDGVEVDALVFQGPHRLSIMTVPIQRPQPSRETFSVASRKGCVKRGLVNWLP